MVINKKAPKGHFSHPGLSTKHHPMTLRFALLTGGGHQVMYFGTVGDARVIDSGRGRNEPPVENLVQRSIRTGRGANDPRALLTVLRPSGRKNDAQERGKLVERLQGGENSLSIVRTISHTRRLPDGILGVERRCRSKPMTKQSGELQSTRKWHGEQMH